MMKKTNKKAKIKSNEDMPSKKHIKEQNKTLKNIFLMLSILAFVSILTILLFYNINNFEYKGVKFDILREGGIKFYHTQFPTVIDGEDVNYNVYIRNDPRELEKSVPFNGTINFQDIFVINNSEDFVCDGDGGISMYNLNQVFNALGTKFIKDEKASCDIPGRYGYVQMESGDKTRIKQYWTGCYFIEINNCEILKATERFMVEALVKNNEFIKNNTLN